MSTKFDLIHKTYRLVLISALILALSSCAFFPKGRNAWEPLPITGTVIDCNSSLPLPNVYIDSNKHRSVKTNQVGKFHLTGKQRKVYIYGPYVNYVKVELVFNAEGYKRKTLVKVHGERIHKKLNIGKVCLSSTTNKGNQNPLKKQLKPI